MSVAEVQEIPDTTATVSNEKIDRLGHLFEIRLRKVGRSCIPDFQTTLDFDTTFAECQEVVNALVGAGVVEAVEEEDAKRPEHVRYQLR